MGAVLTTLDIVGSDYRIALIGIMICFCSLASSMLMTLCYGLILRPAIRSLLETSGQARQNGHRAEIGH